MPLPIRVSSRLLIIFGLLFIGMATLLGLEMMHFKQSMLRERREKCQELVENVDRLVQFYYAKILSEHLPLEEAKAYAIQAIQLVHYNDTEYFWIVDADTGRIVMHSAKPDLNGADSLSMQDAKGKYLFREMISIVQKKGAGFLEYWWDKPGAPPDAAFPKISFVKGFTPWHWVIGSGIYIDDVDNAFWSSFYLYASLGLVLLLFTLALVLMVSEGIKKELG